MSKTFYINKGLVPSITCKNQPNLCGNAAILVLRTKPNPNSIPSYLTWEDEFFDGNLENGDNTLQKVFDKLDDLASSNNGLTTTSINTLEKLNNIITDANLIDSDDLATVATTGSYNDLNNKPNLATVATTGSYNDLNNKPNLNFIPLSPSGDNRVVKRDGSTGLLQDSSIIINDDGNMTGANIIYSNVLRTPVLELLYIVDQVDDGNGGQYQASFFPSIYIDNWNAEGGTLDQVRSSNILISDQNSTRQIITDSDIPADLILAVTGDDVDLSTGSGKLTFRLPYAMTLTSVRANVKTAPIGSNIIVDINQNGSTILSTKLSIDANEKTSTTAQVPAVISTSSLDDDTEITIDIDQIGSSIAGSGLKILLKGTRA